MGGGWLMDNNKNNCNSNSCGTLKNSNHPYKIGILAHDKDAERPLKKEEFDGLVKLAQGVENGSIPSTPF